MVFALTSNGTIRLRGASEPFLALIFEIKYFYMLLFFVIAICVLVHHEDTVFEPRHEKTNVCMCENKDADQFREADQRLCFRYIDSMIPLLSKSKISSL